MLPRLGWWKDDLDIFVEGFVEQHEWEDMTQKLIKYVNNKNALDYISSLLDIPSDQFVLLGQGFYGTAYSLPDNSVIKITSSSLEAECVMELFQIQEKNPDAYKEVFPYIYEYGVIDNLYGWDGLFKSPIAAMDIPQQSLYKNNKSQRVFIFPIFWYRRENVEGFRGKVETLEDAFYKAKRLGVDLADTHLDNWGLVGRDGKLVVVMRDLACYSRKRGPGDYDGQLRKKGF